MSIPTGDLELDMLLAVAAEAYYSGDSSDVSDTLRNILIHFGATLTTGENTVDQVRDQDHNLWRE